MSVCVGELVCGGFFLQAEDGIRDLVRSRGLGDVYKRQDQLRAVLDLLVLVGKAERQRVARVVGPLDDVDELLSLIHI